MLVLYSLIPPALICLPSRPTIYNYIAACKKLTTDIAFLSKKSVLPVYACVILELRLANIYSDCQYFFVTIAKYVHILTFLVTVMYCDVVCCKIFGHSWAICISTHSMYFFFILHCFCELIPT